MLLRVEVIKSDPWLTAKGSTLLNYSVKTNPWPDDWFQTYTHTHTQTYATVFICDANTHSHTSSLSFWYTPTDTLRSVSLSFINQHTQTALRSSNRRSLQTRNAVLNMSSDDPPSLLSSLSSTVRISVFLSQARRHRRNCRLMHSRFAGCFKGCFRSTCYCLMITVLTLTSGLTPLKKSQLYTDVSEREEKENTFTFTSTHAQAGSYSQFSQIWSHCKA